jgi:DNA polymerase III subunit gamma/tau
VELQPPFPPLANGWERVGSAERIGAGHGDRSNLQMDQRTNKDSGEATGGYRVLARKYRPARFDDLIGQDAMVRTLRNAFTAGRIAHAWMLTGVRGVGKTTTARILARGLNHQSPDGAGGPTIDLPEGEGVHCRAILEGRHPDVVEMDAASHTGIDDIRDIIDSARYSPVSARYKVYIIDEVHMLSKAAFNGLLKSLEEPPAHVKFIFATTEVRRVPVTVLSRCQRFDLKRIETARLIDHLSWVAEKEAIETEAEALRLIARAAEGSVRDALSIFDQAIAHGGGKVSAAEVQEMLGLADRAHTIDLFEAVMAGNVDRALAQFDALYESGADPIVVLTDLAEFTHLVTRLKLAPVAAADAAVSEAERVRGGALAAKLSVRVLSRAWQMLLKGLQETAQAPRPRIAADMVLVRLCHAADLPTPDETLRLLREGSGEPHREHASVAPAPTASPPASAGGRGASARAATAEPEPRAAGPDIRAFADIVALAEANRDRLLRYALERHVRPVRVEPGRLEIGLTAGSEPDLAQRLSHALGEWTGRRWVVAVAQADNVPTLHEERRARQASAIAEVEGDPRVESVLSHFPGARIVGVRPMDQRDEAGREIDLPLPEKDASGTAGRDE